MDRIPFQVTPAGSRYSFGRLPVQVVLSDVRSLYNVGAFFRTCDAAGVGALHLCGITGYPPSRQIHKTALGAEESVPWQRSVSAIELIKELRTSGHEIAAIETSLHAVDLFDWRPRFPVCLVFGNEVEGIDAELNAACDTHIRIPMLGVKHSLNVATAGGIVIYELLRKYRDATLATGTQ